MKILFPLLVIVWFIASADGWKRSSSCLINSRIFKRLTNQMHLLCHLTIQLLYDQQQSFCSTNILNILKILIHQNYRDFDNEILSWWNWNSNEVMQWLACTSLINSFKFVRQIGLVWPWIQIYILRPSHYHAICNSVRRDANALPPNSSTFA